MTLSKPVWRKWAAIAGALVLVLIAIAWMCRATLSHIAREKMLNGLHQSFASDVEVKSLNVQVFPRLHIDGEGFVLHYKGRRDLPPLISIRRMTADDNWIALLTGHIRQMRLEGLEIQVPPKEPGAPPAKKSTSERIAGFVVDEVIADGTTLRTLSRDPGKIPLVWQIRRLRMHGAGAHSPMTFRAALENAEPPGEIESTGNFGPWQAEDPGATPVEGQYTFRNADLSVFKGILGTLSSEGKYRGELARIEVDGTTDTPNFGLKISGNTVDLKTRFHAIVDGTNGDTQLQPVNAQFGETRVVAEGSVEGNGGVKGKTVSLNIGRVEGRLSDLLRLAVKGPPAMTGAVAFKGRLVVPPGNQDIAGRVQLQGQFDAVSAHFTQLDIQEKVNRVSHGGEGEPEKPPTDSVASNFDGRFQMASGTIVFQSVSFEVPGVSLVLHGSYGLLDEKLDFHGTAAMEAKLSQATTGVKSLLLKVVDPFFSKKGEGAVIPLHIGGTREKPTFGLDLRSGKQDK